MPRSIRWSFWAISNVQPLLLTILLNTRFLPENERDPKAVAKAREQIPPYLDVLETALRGKEHLVGNRFTVADLNAASVLGLATMMGIDLDGTLSVKAWLDRVHARPSFQKTMSAG